MKDPTLPLVLARYFVKWASISLVVLENLITLLRFCGMHIFKEIAVCYHGHRWRDKNHPSKTKNTLSLFFLFTLGLRVEKWKEAIGLANGHFLMTR